MIIDCFMFYNEYDLLEGRLEYLYDKVDHFVISEANITHTGKVKPFNFMQNITRYQKYLDKILYFPLIVDGSKYDWNIPQGVENNESAAWQMDTMQREHIISGLKLFGPGAIVMISDLDEIPLKPTIDRAIKSLNINNPAVTLWQDQHWYNLKQKQIKPWPGTVVTSNATVKKHGIQVLRNARWTLPGIENGGWHLSYWGTPEHIQNKLNSFTHQELNTAEVNSIENIQKKIAEGKELFGRVGFECVPIDPTTLHPDLVRIFSKYVPTWIPHFHESVEGWFSPGDMAFYKESLDKFPGPAHFVEVGSYKGKSSSFMAVEIANSKKSIKFDCVDTWLGAPEHQAGGALEDPDVVNDTMYDVFTQNMKLVKDYYTAVRMTSVEAAATYADNSLDFVFIDADHAYESVREDIIAWWPKVKKGGIISGHDYHGGAPGVMFATNELFGFVRVTANCWWVKKEI